MHTTTFARKPVAIARSAGALTIPFVYADRTPEQATALSALIAHFDANAETAAACYTFASQPDTKRVRAPKPASDDIAAAKRANADTASKPGNGAKPDKPAAAKPEKPAKPADTSKADAASAREALVGELRNLVAGLYNGPSLAVRSNPKRIAAAVYSDLFDAPKHRTELAKLTARDESALMLCLKRGDKAGAFDPAAINLDSGVFSRLRSVGFIVRSGDGYALTTDALTHARKAAKRAA